jgi:hypothetical protein
MLCVKAGSFGAVNASSFPLLLMGWPTLRSEKGSSGQGDKALKGSFVSMIRRYSGRLF